ncbi:EthD family reductase [Laceyella putida]|uniref:EthD family reductase n=1 Tax=Laceyella putida TaxID=110101 RepID=A0ABW2RG54_9BACL
MYKTVGLYKRMDNEEEFYDYYTNVVVPQLLNIPGVLKVEVTRLHSTQISGDDTYFLMGETYFANYEAFQRVLSSPEGQAAITAMLNKAEDFMTAYVGQEESFKTNIFTTPHYIG